MFEIRNIEIKDFYKNYLDLLSELSHVSPTHFKIFRSNLKDILNNPFHYIFVIEHNSKIIASITLLIEQKIIHNFKKVGHIEDLVVKKEYRNKKLGKRLIQFCIDFAKDSNCYKIILNCSDTVLPFYKKLGFNNSNNQMSIYF
jgi:glucosamine-phosphate N-acetyltransferase